MKINNVIPNEKHNLYILRSFGKNGETIIKFGFSKNIKERINRYYSMNPYIELLFTCYQKEGISYEKLTHSLLTPNYKTEWYNEENLDLILSYIFTEDYTCYNDFNLPKIEMSLHLKVKDLFKNKEDKEDKEYKKDLDCFKSILKFCSNMQTKDDNQNFNNYINSYIDILTKMINRNPRFKDEEEYQSYLKL